MARTKNSIFGKIASAVGLRKIDDSLLEEIEEILIGADVGVKATMRLIESVRTKADQKGTIDGEQIYDLLREEIRQILAHSASNVERPGSTGPVVWLIVGVNGVGKTTTIGKLANYFSQAGQKVIIAACDTFRAAAIDQISIWAERSKVDIVKSQSGSDPAAVAFDAATAAGARNADLLLVDTAGRLHTKSNLMEELKKMRRVITKALPTALIQTKIILDGSTGQNALEQVRVFADAVGCDGLIVTKLDGTARGGMIIAVAEELGVPIDFVGLGEGVEDIQRFESDKFVEALFS